MKKIEIILLVLILVSVILIFWAVPGANEIFAMASTVLSMMYFYLGFLILNDIRLRGIFKKASYSHVKRANIVFAILTGIVLGQLIVGILFKMLFLPGAYEMLSIALTFGGVVLLAAFAVTRVNDYDFKNIFIRLVPAVLIAFILFNIQSSALIRVIYRYHPEYAEAFIDSLDNPDDEALEKKAQEAYDAMYED